MNLETNSISPGKTKDNDTMNQHFSLSSLESKANTHRHTHTLTSTMRNEENDVYKFNLYIYI